MNGEQQLQPQRRQYDDPLNTQIGGNHYKTLGIQPVEYIRANNLGYFEGNVVKYVTRWKDKDGIKDLEKARHYLDLLISFEHKKAQEKRAMGSVIGQQNLASGQAQGSEFK